VVDSWARTLSGPKTVLTRQPTQAGRRVDADRPSAEARPITPPGGQVEAVVVHVQRQIPSCCEWPGRGGIVESHIRIVGGGAVAARGCGCWSRGGVVLVVDGRTYGATMVYLLSESHLSVHTFLDEGKITLDLFTCDTSLDDTNLKKIIGDYFGVSFLNIDMYFFTRG
jgi:hypothetical protein